MFTIIILLLLLHAFFSGARRGFTLQVVYTVGYVISFIVARMYYQTLAAHLELYIPYPAVTPDTELVFFGQTISFSLDQAFYAGVAFLMILFVGWLLTRLIGVFAHGLTFVPILHQLDWVAGGLLSLVVMYVGIFLILVLLSMIPADFVQNQLRNSGISRFIIENTPILTKQIQDLWINDIIK
ncbi:MAG: CvpA family protein [Enterococcus sp.]